MSQSLSNLTLITLIHPERICSKCQVWCRRSFYGLIWYRIDNWRKHAKQYALHAFKKIINTASTCGRSAQIKYHLQRSSSGTWYILKHGNIGSSGLWRQILNENVIPHNKSFCSYVHYWNKGTSRLINQHRVLFKKKNRIFRNSCINISQSIREKFYETKRYATAESDINYVMNNNMNLQWYICVSLFNIRSINIAI